MPNPDQPHDDNLSELFSRLRDTPPAPTADPARIALGFETRVLARVRAEAAVGNGSDTFRWFWRWSAVFGTAAIACAVLVVQNYQSLTADAFTTLDGGVTLLDFFY